MASGEGRIGVSQDPCLPLQLEQLCSRLLYIIIGFSVKFHLGEAISLLIKQSAKIIDLNYKPVKVGTRSPFCCSPQIV